MWSQEDPRIKLYVRAHNRLYKGVDQHQDVFVVYRTPQGFTCCAARYSNRLQPRIKAVAVICRTHFSFSYVKPHVVTTFTIMKIYSFSYNRTDREGYLDRSAEWKLPNNPLEKEKHRKRSLFYSVDICRGRRRRTTS